MSDLNNVIKLNPLTKFCMTIGNIPSSYLISMTYEEQLLWLCNYLEKTVIPAIDNNANCVTELQNLYIQLKNYVDNYFEDLDVQKEINNKIDEMLNNGSLLDIIQNAFNVIPQSNLNFTNILNKKFYLADLYNGVSHDYLQGICCINNNIVFALRNVNNEDNIVRLLEYSLLTGNLIRENYLELCHANSITYNPKNNKLYVAHNSQYINGVWTADNRISVINYNDLSFDEIIEIENIPENERIRSVFYDSVHDIFYGANIYKIFEIDLENRLITKTIKLDNSVIDTSITAQTTKRLNNMFVGLFNTFLVFWNLNGSIIRVTNIEQFYENQHLGEIEDFTFDNKSNIIIGSTHSDQSPTTSRIAEFWKSNALVNSSNVINQTIFRADTSNVTIYVDNTSTKVKEDGSENYPFKSLQRAVNFAKNSTISTSIVINGNSYDFTYIADCKNLYLQFNENVVIDGLRIANSSAQIYCASNSKFEINGLQIDSSNISFLCSSLNKSIINPSSKFINNRTLYATFSSLYFNNLILNGDNSQDSVLLERKTDVVFNNCTFDNNENHYAIYINEGSILHLYDNTFNFSPYKVRASKGSLVFKRNGMINKNEITIDTQSNVYPSWILVPSTDVKNTIIGEVCDLDSNYTHVVVRMIFPLVSGRMKTVIIPINDVNGHTADSYWANDQRLALSLVTFSKENNKLIITENRTAFKNNDGTNELSIVSNSEQERLSDINYMRVQRVYFANL